MNNVVRYFVFASVLFFLPVVLTGVTGIPPGSDGTGGSSFVVADSDGVNETVRHRKPARYDEDGDTAAVTGWLSDRLSDRLGESTVALEQEEYEQASEYLDDEYYERLEQFVEVTGETDGRNGDDETDGDDITESFETAAEEQERLINRTRQYRETKAEYEAARESGDVDRARELARELEALATDIEEGNETISKRYEILTGETDRDFSAEKATIENTTRSIQQEQETVRKEQFVETELNVSTTSETISFRDPLPVRGEIRTGDGSTVAETDGRILVGNEPVDVETWDNGTVEFEYRPAAEPLSTERLTVQYVPAARSTYLGTETSVPVSIEQTEGEIRNLEVSETAAYNESLSVTGDVVAAERPVDGAVVTVSLGDHDIGRLPVADGHFSESIPVPAAVADGDRTLRVSLPEGRALAPTTAARNVTITETETTLELEAERTNASAVRIAGTLATIDGDGLENQTVGILVDGESADTVTTDENGAISATIALAAETEREITATYDGAETNLEGATETVRLSPLAKSGTDGGFGVPTRASLLAGFGVITLAACLGWWYRSRRESIREPPSWKSTRQRSTVDREPGERSQAMGRVLLENAHTHLANGRSDEAVRACYAAARASFESDIEADRSDSLTHWEFYRQYGTDVGNETFLRELTEAYERAAFMPATVSSEDAERLLETTRHVCDSPGSEPSRNTHTERGAPSNDG
ncbi:DUF4129 domain-containing protein [Halopiger djelfimassiliensis]|uniref:DUF4129 domain-containing protein n=1 Tax=Halopiger djelfimassiliensis TaxID=1293047 RepID=UPI000677B58D|nr:DUF4129 domain-containing protein [Halopiger djelfimassiliensis]